MPQAESRRIARAVLARLAGRRRVLPRLLAGQEV